MRHTINDSLGMDIVAKKILHLIFCYREFVINVNVY